MTTSGTKTRALCVATRCTTVEQFVATFHRFCGDDQSFFVATLTSRPIGLETPFAIQLADKQPVLRGLCVVLDAWPTPENRFKRPGIRLGIKHLTADSQLVFERMRAASKMTGGAEATPPPGPPPDLLLTALGSPPAIAVPAARSAAPPPRLPVPPPLPRAITAGRVASLPAIPPPGSPRDPEISAIGTPPPAPPPAPPPTPAPIAVTRFQVALSVDGVLPSTDDIEFKPTELPQRPRFDPKAAERVVSFDDVFAPAVIVERPIGRSIDPQPRPVSVPRPAAELRTPGSPLVLPANPLHDVSDESIEGFVNCTLYEESGNSFHPSSEGGDTSDPPALSRGSEPVAAAPDAPAVAPAPQALAMPAPYAPGHAYPAYPSDPAPYASDTPAPEGHAPVLEGYPPPEAAALPPEPVWRRWLVIGGTAAAALVIAFVVARLVRGSTGASSPFAASEGAIVASRSSLASPPSPPAPPAPSPPAIDRAPAQDLAVTSAGIASIAREDKGGTAIRGARIAGTGSCRLTVTTTPVGSFVRLDELEMGASPLNLDTTCERHKIEISRARYQSQTRWVTLVADEPNKLDVQLLRPIHAVTVTSFPPGAEFSIDGRRAGTTPTVVQMMGFATVSLTFSKAGFQSVTKRVYSKVAADHVFVKLMK